MFTLNCGGRLHTFDAPVVMGIINATPDSFYSGSRVQVVEQAVEQAERMLQEGAAILDIGGQSTRPGSEHLDSQSEARRVIPVIEAIHAAFPGALLSVDTYYATVAAAAIDAGASIVNDISGGKFDAAMLTTVAALRVPYICMHIRGTPQTMQQNPVYGDIAQEVLDYFIERAEACRRAGIQDLLIDPGFGFGKTIRHNFELLEKLPVLNMLNRPVLVGLSRKSTVYKTLGTTPDQALNGSTVLHTISILKGAAVLRVHDVQEAVETIQLVQAYTGYTMAGDGQQMAQCH